MPAIRLARALITPSNPPQHLWNGPFRKARYTTGKIHLSYNRKLGVMRAPQVLLTIALLLFVGFLVSPGFVDSVKGDGTVTMLPGFAAVTWQALSTPSAVTHSPREALVLIPLLLAHVAFVILPLTVALGRFRPRALRYTF